MPTQEESALTGEQHLPFDLEAEACLLGCIMHEGVVLDEIDGITCRSFYHTAHGLIFPALQDLHTANQDTGPVSLRAELVSRGLLEKIGGAEYIATLFISVASAANARRYADIVKEHQHRRRLIETANAILAEAADPTVEIGTVTARAVESFEAEAQASGSLWFPRLDPKTSPPPVEWLLPPLFPTGCLCGLQGDPGSGKSYLLLDACLRTALGQSWLSEGRPAINAMFLDCERSRELALTRIHDLTQPEDRTRLDTLHYVFPTRNDSTLRFLALDDPGNRRGITEAILRAGANFVTIDSLSRLWGKLDPNRDGATLGGWLREIVDKTGATICIIHHVTKGDPKFRQAAPHIRDWRGSGALPAGLDVQLAMVARTDDYVLHVLRSVWTSGHPRWSVSRDEETRRLRFIPLEGKQPVKSENFEGFLKSLALVGGLSGVSLDELRRRFRDKTQESLSDETARRVVAALIQQGWVCRGKVGKTWLYRLQVPDQTTDDPDNNLLHNSLHTENDIFGVSESIEP